MGKYTVRIDRDRVAEARKRLTDFYSGRPVDYMPFRYSCGTPDCPSYTIGDIARDPDKAIELAIAKINAQTNSYPDTDFSPSLQFEYLGEGMVASMFGAKQYIVENDPPFTEGRFMNDIYDLHKLPREINPAEDGWGPILKETIEKFLDATNGEIPVGVCDHQSTYGTATKIINNEALMYAMYDEPEMVHEFFDIVTRGIEATIDAMSSWAGGAERLVHNITASVPGTECGLIIWDNYISVINPELHMEFCKPYNDRLYERYGRGHLHTCGPYFPGYIDATLACKPRSLDFAIMRGMSRSKEDIRKFRQITRDAGIILSGSPNSTSAGIFEGKWDTIEEDYLLDMATGGMIYSESGPPENGKAATERFRKISDEAFRRMGKKQVGCNDRYLD